MRPLSRAESRHDYPRLTGLVVSCQANGDNPMAGPHIMSAVAMAAAKAGASGIRANGARDIATIRAQVNLPMIGIKKTEPRGAGLVYITPDLASVDEVINAGADIVATDGTPRPRPGGATLRQIVDHTHQAGGVVMADIDTLESARFAVDAGVDFVATTLAGYTSETWQHGRNGPDLGLVKELVTNLRVPVVAEGRYATPELARAAIEAGACAVVVGTAITNPAAITQTYLQAITQGVDQ